MSASERIRVYLDLYEGYEIRNGRVFPPLCAFKWIGGVKALIAQCPFCRRGVNVDGWINNETPKLVTHWWMISKCNGSELELSRILGN